MAEIFELGSQRLVEADEKEDRRVNEPDMCAGGGGGRRRLSVVDRRGEEALGRVVVAAHPR